MKQIAGADMNLLLRVLAIFCLAFVISSYAQEEKMLGLSSPSIQSQQAIPKLYTCEDKNISPELAWNNVPENTQSLALILSDPDAPGGVFYHWVLYNISPTIISLNEGESEIPGTVGKNSYGKTIYNGPCPPKGSTHSYVFTLYALDISLNVPASADAKTVLAAMQNHILGEATLTSSFGR